LVGVGVCFLPLIAGVVVLRAEVGEVVTSSEGSGTIILGFLGSPDSTRMRLATRRLEVLLSGNPVTVILSPIFNFEKAQLGDPVFFGVGGDGCKRLYIYNGLFLIFF